MWGGWGSRGVGMRVLSDRMMGKTGGVGWGVGGSWGTACWDFILGLELVLAEEMSWILVDGFSR